MPLFSGKHFLFILLVFICFNLTAVYSRDNSILKLREQLSMEMVSEDENFMGPYKEFLSKQEIKQLTDEINGEISLYVSWSKDMKDKEASDYIHHLIYRSGGLRDKIINKEKEIITNRGLSSKVKQDLVNFTASLKSKDIYLICLIIVVIIIMPLFYKRKRFFILSGSLIIICLIIYVTYIVVVRMPAILKKNDIYSVKKLNEDDFVHGKNVYYVKPLVNREYYFSLIEDIEKAESTIFVSMYLFQMDRTSAGPVNTIINELINAAKRHVSIFVLLEKSKGRLNSELNMENKRTLKKLEQNGINVKFDSKERETHEKIVLIDEQVMYISNHNWSYSALMRNDELGMRIASRRMPDDIFKYIYKHFSKDTEFIKKVSFKKLTDKHNIVVKDLIFLKDSLYFFKLRKLLINSRKNITVVMYYVNRTERKTGKVNILLDELVNAHKRKVKVKVIFDDNMKDKNISAYDYLKKNGVDVSFDNNPKIMHTKIVIVDDKYVLLGSHNWTNSAFNSNHETSVCVNSPETALYFKSRLLGKK